MRESEEKAATEQAKRLKVNLHGNKVMMILSHSATPRAAAACRNIFNYLQLKHPELEVVRTPASIILPRPTSCSSSSPQGAIPSQFFAENLRASPGLQTSTVFTVP